MTYNERCEVMNPKATPYDPGFPRDHYERCILPAGHSGRHDDVYGRWWGKLASRPRGRVPSE